MKAVIFFISGLILSLQLHAQRCASEAQTLRAIAEEEEYVVGLAEMDSLAAAFEMGSLNESMRSDSIAYVPVVVHVLYRTEEQNISFEQIKSQIEVLNRDFNWEASDKDKIPEVFRSVGQACRIQFQLADKDPFGNFTNGVTRKQTDILNIGSEAIYHRSSKGGTDPWPQPHYLNIWVCELEGQTLGFAILPSNNMSERDGIVMSPYAFGTTGVAMNPHKGGRTLVHEVGHYFGLRHPWGKSEDGGCQSTDHMSDTPKQEKENFGCETFPHFSCGGEPNGDMFMNFMDYAVDTCMLLFTKQQVNFMRLVLRKNRATLFHSDGYTGVNETVQRTWKVYPTPSNDIVFLEGDDDAAVEVYSSRGDLIRLLHHESGISKMNVSDLNPGFYWVKIEDFTQKIVVW